MQPGERIGEGQGEGKEKVKPGEKRKRKNKEKTYFSLFSIEITVRRGVRIKFSINLMGRSIPV